MSKRRCTIERLVQVGNARTRAERRAAASGRPRGRRSRARHRRRAPSRRRANGRGRSQRQRRLGVSRPRSAEARRPRPTPRIRRATPHSRPLPDPCSWGHRRSMDLTELRREESVRLQSGRSPLSVCCMTSGRRPELLAGVLAPFREVADEIVVAVDATRLEAVQPAVAASPTGCSRSRPRPPPTGRSPGSFALVGAAGS